ncbi:MAG TPA: ABC transporter ATP-binding protein [Verrucomicrobiae bacterium]|nr:ABC transporter ATP-binding protein [Verrucomicrobiae bacterium]
MGPPLTHAIRCEHLSKRFGAVTALEALSLEVGGGTIFGYLGANGAGKTTTIRLLLGLLRPDAGHVAVLGGDPRAPESRRQVGYLPAELRLDHRCTAFELLSHWATLRGGVERAYRDRLIERVQLDPGRRVRQLSSGNRRKVGLVAAFMARPRLLVLDEPTQGLDPLVQAEFVALLREVRGEGATVFLSSHVLTEVQRCADRVAVLRRGSVVREGTVETLRHLARQPFDVEFDGPAPTAELAAVPGVADLWVDGGHARWVVTGPLQPLLAVLAAHPVRSLSAPEPDLEAAVLSLYSEVPRA